MITSLQNQLVKHVAALHEKKGRKQYGEFLIEGKRFVQEALLRKAKIKTIYYCLGKSEELRLKDFNLIDYASETGIALEEVSFEVMRKMSATEQSQGILAVIEMPGYDWENLSMERSTILLILDGIQDPGNLGTIFRTALAADVKQIILTERTADPYNPKVLRSSMGSIFSQIILKNKSPEEIAIFCSKHKYKMVISDIGGKSIFEQHLSEEYPLALIIGSEAEGPSDYFSHKAELKFSIPMFNNVESLNAAMSAGIFLYELRRQGQFL